MRTQNQPAHSLLTASCTSSRLPGKNFNRKLHMALLPLTPGRKGPRAAHSHTMIQHATCCKNSSVTNRAVGTFTRVQAPCLSRGLRQCPNALLLPATMPLPTKRAMGRQHRIASPCPSTKQTSVRQAPLLSAFCAMLPARPATVTTERAAGYSMQTPVDKSMVVCFEGPNKKSYKQHRCCAE